MANQQKQVLTSAVVVNDHLFHVFMTPFGLK